MKHRQSVHHAVGRSIVDQTGRLIDIADDGGMTEHHSLGPAFRPGRKQDNTRSRSPLSLDFAPSPPNRGHFFKAANGRGEIFQIENPAGFSQTLHQLVQSGFFDESPGSEHRFYPGIRGAVDNIPGSGGKIEHRRGFPQPKQGEQQRHMRHGVGHQHSDRRFRSQQFRQFGGKSLDSRQ